MTRQWLLVLGFFMAVITYLDRVCISAAAPAMSHDLSLTRMQMGYVFSAFALAYAIFEIPSGWLGDRWGQRRMLTRIVAGWSVFTILTGLVTNYASLLAARFVFGAAEAGAFPTLSRALARWFPQSQRARANGIMWMGARLGGAIAPPVAALLVSRIGWRMTFVFFGSIGILWCIVFWRGYQDDPEGRVSGVHTPAPWREMFTSGTMWALFAMYFCSAYGFYFFVTWLPTFLMKDHGLTLETSGLYAALPLAAGAIGCVAGGELSDWLVRRTGSLKWSRRIIGIGGFLLAAAGFGLAAVAPTPAAAILSLAFASGAHDLMLPVAWATCVDAGGRFGGTTGGFMNMASSISAMISSVSAAWFSTAFGSFHVMLAVAAGTYFVGGMLWLAIDPAKKLDTSQ